MVKFKWLVILVLFLIAVQPSFADDRTRILGIWKLISFESEFQATGERVPTLGKNPTGYIIFTPEGRFMAVITGDGRMAPKTDQDRADLLKSMFAYTGIPASKATSLLLRSMFPGTLHGLALSRYAFSDSKATDSKSLRRGCKR